MEITVAKKALNDLYYLTDFNAINIDDFEIAKFLGISFEEYENILKEKFNARSANENNLVFSELDGAKEAVKWINSKIDSVDNLNSNKESNNFLTDDEDWNVL